MDTRLTVDDIIHLATKQKSVTGIMSFSANIKDCSFRVFWHEPDQSYIATCDQFPSLSWCEEKPDKAIRGMVALVAEVIEDMLTTGEIELAKKALAETKELIPYEDIRRRLGLA